MGGGKIEYSRHLNSLRSQVYWSAHPLTMFLFLFFLTPIKSEESWTSEVVVAIKQKVYPGNFSVSNSLHNKISFSGRTISISEDISSWVLLLPQNSFIEGQFNASDHSRFYIEIKSGPQKGKILDIISNDTNHLTIEKDTLFDIEQEFDFILRKHITISQIFENIEPYLTAWADGIKFWDNKGNMLFFMWTGDSWIDFNYNNADEFPAHPGYGLIGAMAHASPYFIRTGYIKDSDLLVKIWKHDPELWNQDLISPLLPIDHSLASLNILDQIEEDKEVIQITGFQDYTEKFYKSYGSFLSEDGIEDAGEDILPAGVFFVLRNNETGFWRIPNPVVSDKLVGIDFKYDSSNGILLLGWNKIIGETYFIQHSFNAQNWHYLPIIESGSSSYAEVEVSASDFPLFLRLKGIDLQSNQPELEDFDNDKVSNWEELLQATDPLASLDKNTNNLPDDWEIYFGISELGTNESEDTDADGLSNASEFLQNTNPLSQDNPALKLKLLFP